MKKIEVFSTPKESYFLNIQDWHVAYAGGNKCVAGLIGFFENQHKYYLKQMNEAREARIANGEIQIIDGFKVQTYDKMQKYMLGFFGRNTIINSVRFLEETKVLFSYGTGNQKKYKFNPEPIQEFIDKTWIPFLETIDRNEDNPLDEYFQSLKLNAENKHLELNAENESLELNAETPSESLKLNAESPVQSLKVNDNNKESSNKESIDKERGAHDPDFKNDSSPLPAESQKPLEGGGGAIPIPKPKLPPEEQRIQDAIKVAAEYLKEYPVMVDKCREAAKDPNLSKQDIYEELKVWVRYYSKEIPFLADITKNISSSFILWMQRYQQFKPKEIKSKPEKQAAKEIYIHPKSRQEQTQDKIPVLQTIVNKLHVTA